MGTLEHDLTTAIWRKGIPLALARSVAAEVAAGNKTRYKRTRRNDWVHLIAPIRKQIQSLAAGLCRKDIPQDTYKIHSAYLALLRKARDKLLRLAKEATQCGVDIPGMAARKGVPNEGMCWADWVPDHIKAPYYAAFALHYTKYPRGRRITPFVTHYERTPSEIRWDRLQQKLLLQVIGMHTAGSDNFLLMHCMLLALDVINKRSGDDIAPVRWEHLLPKEEQRLLATYLTLTVNGLRALPADPEDIPGEINAALLRAEHYCVQHARRIADIAKKPPPTVDSNPARSTGQRGERNLSK